MKKTVDVGGFRIFVCVFGLCICCVFVWAGKFVCGTQPSVSACISLGPYIILCGLGNLVGSSGQSKGRASANENIPETNYVSRNRHASLVTFETFISWFDREMRHGIVKNVQNAKLHMSVTKNHF